MFEVLDVFMVGSDLFILNKGRMHHSNIVHINGKIKPTWT